jgi:hypothetical protein
MSPSTWLRLLPLSLLAFAIPTYAAYNANTSGVVAWVASYTDGDYIYFGLQNQPTSHPQCSPYYFVITADVPENRRNQAFAQLLTSKQTGTAINIGYDATGDCAYGYIRVHRVG